MTEHLDGTAQPHRTARSDDMPASPAGGPVERFALALPPGWYDFALATPADENRIVARVRERLAADGTEQRVVGPFLSAVRRAVGQARVNGALFAAGTFELYDDGLLVASMLVARVTPAEGDPAAALLSLGDSGAPDGTWYRVGTALLPGIGQVARVHGVQDLTVDDDTLRCAVMQTVVPLPGTADVLVVSASSPNVAQAEELFELFAAVTATLRPVGPDDDPADGTEDGFDGPTAGPPVDADEGQHWMVLPRPGWVPGPEEESPPVEDIVGAWSVDADGSIGPFEPNPYYRPATDEPTDPVDGAARLAIAGQTAPETVLLVLRDVLCEVALDETGAPVVAVAPDGSPCVLVTTGAAHRAALPVPEWRPVDLAGLTALLPDGVDVWLNPGGPASMRLFAAAVREHAQPVRGG